ncbi:MAG: RNA polymerase sigma factor [Acidobacteria bacterium]|nr:RNA polymerase sigma factor [Acidobacteriota bacterium]
MTPFSTMMTWSAVPEPRAAATISSADDAALIDRFLRTGDEEIFEILIRPYQEKVFRLAASILGRGAESEAEDATQEVFVVLLRQLKTFRRECAFSTWLYRVARNQIIEYRRRVSRRASHVDADVLRIMPDGGTLADPQKVAATGQKRERVMYHVDRLSEPQRVVVYLHYWQGQSIAEIAELLDLKLSTVKSHLCRARQRLAIALREEGCNE